MNTAPLEADFHHHRNQLTNAIDALIGTQTEVIDGIKRFAPSLWQQLLDEKTGNQGSGRAGTNRSIAPGRIDAIDLIRTVERETFKWVPLDTTSTVPDRLNTLDRHPWRPQDITKIEGYTRDLNRWVAKIGKLFNPEPVVTLPNPCPSCGVAATYRRDDAGDNVRIPVLQIGRYGCECVHCGAQWSPERYVFLSRVLGYDLPAGVLG